MRNNLTNSLLSPWQRLWRLLNGERKLLGKIFLIAAFGGLIGLSLPLGIQAIINFIQAGRVSTSWIVLISFVLLGIFFSGWLQIRQQWLTEYLQQRIFSKASIEFSVRLPKLLFRELEKRNPAELMNRFFDVLTLQKGISKLIIDFSTAVLQIFFGLILLGLYHPFFILFDFALIILMFFLFRMAMRRGLNTSIQESTWKYSVVRWLEEVALNLESFRMTPATTMAEKQTDNLTDKYLDARTEHFKVLVRHYIALLVFKLIIAAGLLLLGSLLVINNQIGIGQFVAAEIVILLISSSVEKVMLNLETVYDVLTALEKVGSVTDLKLEPGGSIKNQSSNAPLLKMEDVIIQEDNYTSQLEIEELQINEGDRVFISYEHPFLVRTMVQLITARDCNFQGHVHYRGKSLKTFNKDLYRISVGEIWGRATLFTDTVFENIRMGRDIPDESVDKVLNEMGLIKDVRFLPEGENTMVLPFSNLLSNSLTKGILLARMVVDKPDILIVDAEQLPSDPVRKKQLLNYLLDPIHPWALIFLGETDPGSEFFDLRLKYDDGVLRKES